MSQKVCLVVTGDKSTWGNGDVIFVSPNMVSHSERKKIGISSEIIQGPWNTVEYKSNHKEFVIRKIIKYRKEISTAIGKELNIKYSEREWRILLDSWIYHFVSIVYERINYINNAKQKVAEIYLSCGIDAEYKIDSTVDFCTYSRTDGFNQYLYCEAAKVLGIECRSINEALRKDSHFDDGIRRVSDNLCERISAKLSGIIRWMVGKWIIVVKPLVIVDGYFPVDQALTIMARSFGRVIIIPSRYILPLFDHSEYNLDIRNNILIKEDDDYDKLANRLLKRCLPISMLEGHLSYKSKIKHIKSIPALGSAVGFYHDDGYKLAAISVSKAGGKIIGFQHGGNYNIYNYYIHELEVSSADEYYYWTSQSYAGEKLPATKLDKANKYRNKRIRNKSFSCILLVSGPFVHLPEIRYSPILQNKEQFDEQLKFYDNMALSIRDELVVRPREIDGGWGYRERWNHHTNNNVRFDEVRLYYDSLVSRKIVVIDHISTTWLEALYCDVPIIIYFDYERYDIKEAVKDIYRLLESVSVMHRTPESAASFLNKKYNNIEPWWRGECVVNAVNETRKYFYNNEDKFSEKWTDELLFSRSNIVPAK